MDVTAAVEWLQTIVFVGLGVAALRRWISHRSAPAAWLGAVFGSIATVVVVSRLIPEGATGPVASLAQALNVAILATVPLFAYLLAESYREGRLRPAGYLAAALTAIVAIWGASLSPFPEEAAGRTLAHESFLLAFGAQWTALSGAAVAVLWRAVRGRPRLTRIRLRLLAAGLGLLNLVLVGAIVAGPEASETTSTVLALAATVSAMTSYLSFAPSGLLNALLRQQSGRAAAAMQAGLLAATTPAEVADALLPFLHELLGLDVLLLDRDGGLIAVAGQSRDRAEVLAAAAYDNGGWSPDTHVVELDAGWLVLPHSRLVPFLSDDERDLLTALVGQLDLGLERARLLESERDARQEAEQARAEVEKIVFGLAHDLQSPVVAIQAFADLLRRDALDVEQRREAAARIGASAEYTSQLLSDLLGFARIGRSAGAPQHLRLDVVVDQVTDQLRATTTAPRVRMEGPVPELYIDPTQLRQVLTNLLSNAARHAGRDDVEVTIRSEARDGGGLRLSVRDNGCGVPEEHRERVFELFERGSARAAGSGVGLTIVRRLVENLGGRVVLGPGGPGAEFLIDLPPSVVESVGTDDP